MNSTSKSVDFFYGTYIGRIILKTVMKLHLDKIAVKFLKSKYSRIINKRFVKSNNIPLTPKQTASFHTFRELFLRNKPSIKTDCIPTHLISPCDGWLSVFKISDRSCFSIKNSHYKIDDFLQDKSISQKFIGGTCMIFRLCASDYHHYCFIDNGYQGKNHYIEGVLHSVQPIACEKFPVFVLNRRSWCLLETENFGPVVQCEIGALIVGGICNKTENSFFKKGEEKGYFDLAGSTIVLLFEANKIKLNGDLSNALSTNSEIRVTIGEHIATALTDNH